MDGWRCVVSFGGGCFFEGGGGGTGVRSLVKFVSQVLYHVNTGVVSRAHTQYFII